MLFMKPILSDKQHGFQQKSTATNMMYFTELLSIKLSINSKL